MSAESFRRLNGVVSIYEPPKELQGRAVEEKAVAPPTTILVLAWMDASTRHIAKFTARYALLYPSARILLVRATPPDLTWRRGSTQLARLAPAVDALRADPDLHLLTHTFSNAGSHHMANIATAFRRATGGALLPAKAMIIDSSPCRLTLEATLGYVNQGRPKPWYLVACLYFVSVIYVAYHVLVYRLFGKTNVLDRLRRDLNDPKLIPTTAPRCYIYSESDKLIDWRDVEEHAREAQDKGYKVELQKMVGGDHVGHMRTDERAYWDIVTRFWASESL